MEPQLEASSPHGELQIFKYFHVKIQSSWDETDAIAVSTLISSAAAG